MEILKCEACMQTYSEYYSPRILPCCYKTVCHRCINSIKTIKNNKFECIACHEEAEMPIKGFQVNEAIDELLLESCKSTLNETKIEKHLNELENSANQLLFEVDNGDYIIKEHCIELKRKIQLTKEERILEINDISDAMIQRVDDYEKECIRNFSEINDFKWAAKELISQVNSFILKQKVYLSKYSEKVNENENEINSSIRKFNELISAERLNVKVSTFVNNLMKFEPNSYSKDNYSLGIIKHEPFTLKKILSCCYRSIKLIDITTGKCLQTFNDHTDWVRSAKLLKNNTQMASCSQDKTIKIWDITTEKCLRTLTGHSHMVFDIEILANNRIASCSLDRTIRIWNAETGNCLKVLNGHSLAVLTLRKLSDELLISGSRDDTIKLWNITSGKCLRTFTGHENSIFCIEVLSDNRIVSGSMDKKIKVWNLNTGECLQTMKGHSNGVFCMKVLQNEIIISGSGDKTIKFWCLQTNSCIMTLNTHVNTVTGIQVLMGNQVATSSDDKTIKIWNLVTGHCIKTIQEDCGIAFVSAF